MMNRNVRHFAIIAVLILIGTGAMYALISEVFFELPAIAAEQAAQIEPFFQGHYILIAFLFSIIMVPLFYVIVVFRQKPGDETDAPHIHGNTTLEIVWTVIPVLIVLVFAVWGTILYTDVVSARSGEQVIRTIGYKWDWDFHYPDLENRYSQSLVVEVNQPVLLEMQSRDVIHAFWVPEFRVKQDVVPYNTAIAELSFSNEGYEQAARDYNYRPQEIRFTPTETGVYRLRCAEICGTFHWGMLANVFVLSSADYQAWVAGTYSLPADPAFTNADPSAEGFFLEELEQFCDENDIQNCMTGR